MLTQLYQGWDLRKWEEELRHKPDGEKPGWGDDMAEWAEKNPEFLTAALEKQPGPTPTFPAPAPPAPTPGPSPAPR